MEAGRSVYATQCWQGAKGLPGFVRLLLRSRAGKQGQCWMLLVLLSVATTLPGWLATLQAAAWPRAAQPSRLLPLPAGSRLDCRHAGQGVACQPTAGCTLTRLLLRSGQADRPIGN